MTDLESLLERIEKASGPDRELDVAIMTALVPTKSGKPWWFDGKREQGTAPAITTERWKERAARTTASLDAAIGLVERVLPDWAVDVGNKAYVDGKWQGGKWRSNLRAPWSSGPIACFGIGANGSLAILAAILTALIHKDRT